LSDTANMMIENNPKEVARASEPLSNPEGDGVILSLKWCFIGVGFLINSFLFESIFSNNDASLVSGFVGALILTVPIVKKAIEDLISGQHHMNELVAIAVVACLTLEDYRTAGIVAFFMILADLLEHKTASGAKKAIENLLMLTPKKARLIQNEKEIEVEVKEVKISDRILVRPGEQIPVDGIITEGNSAINQANITGESLPVDKEKGDSVFAGTINLSGVLYLEVIKVGDQTTLGRVKELILKAQETRLPIMTVIDKYIGWYTPAVLMISILILFITQKMEPAITILILSCPLSIILATPTAMIAALSAASRVGILIKDVLDFERAAAITVLVFDKTGTLTTGNLSVTRMKPIDDFEPAELLKYTASIENISNHPVARSIVAVAKEAKLELLNVVDSKEIPGKGVEGLIDGKRILVGRLLWLKEKGVDCALPIDEGLSVIHVALDGKEIGWIGLEDKTRAEAIETVSKLKSLGLRKISIFTGDKKAVAEKVSAELGCDEVLSECLPEEKLAYVNELKAKGEKVAVVGDGVNDAAALAAGDLGIAMASGSDVAIGSASVAMMTEDLNKLPFLLTLAKRTRAVVYQNLLFGFIFIFVVGSFAVLEFVNPILGGVLHFFSSIIVIFNSFRIVKMGEEFAPYRVEVDAALLNAENKDE